MSAGVPEMRAAAAAEPAADAVGCVSRTACIAAWAAVQPQGSGRPPGREEVSAATGVGSAASIGTGPRPPAGWGPPRLLPGRARVSGSCTPFGPEEILGVSSATQALTLCVCVTAAGSSGKKRHRAALAMHCGFVDESRTLQGAVFADGQKKHVAIDCAPRLHETVLAASPRK